MDELARLLGDSFENDARMKALLGESREKHAQRLKERLAARQKGRAVIIFSLSFQLVIF